jgi:hypothetical protein
VDGLPWLTHDDFTGRIGEIFDVVDGLPEPLRLTLSSAVEGAEAGGPGPEGATRQQFSLVFLGPPEPLLGQATYRLLHHELGGLDVFLVPLGLQGASMRYEAAFA